MIARMRARWQAIFDHPLLRLELRRIRRRRWWPGRRFFLFYPALMGAVLGCGATLALLALLERLSVPAPVWEMQSAALVTGLPTVCLASTASSVLAFILPWIAPAFTATAIARERELSTLDLLRATLLTERSIVLGKLGGCLAQLWPGILTLALLSPFQLLVAFGGGLLASPNFLVPLAMFSGAGTELPWGWLLLIVLAGFCRPWSDLMLHAAIGLFVSTLARSTGLAVAASYATIIVVRVALYMAMSLLSLVLMIAPIATLDPSGTMLNEPALNTMLMAPSLAALGVVLIQFVGAAVLVWAAVWCLKRT